MNKILEFKSEVITEVGNDNENDFKDNEKEKRNKGKNPIIIFGVLNLLLIVVCVKLILEIIPVGTNAAVAAFDHALDETSKTVYTEFYDRSFKAAEGKHHVKNEITISIGLLRDEAKLEVLKVNDVEYKIHEEKGRISVISKVENLFNDKNKITSWIEIPGQGVFTVNLKASEFIIDDERQYILIRVPKPELTEFSIDYANVKIFNLKTKKFTTASEGEDYIREQFQGAELTMRQNIMTTQRFYQNAKDSTTQILTNLVKELNPQLSELKVDVVFID